MNRSTSESIREVQNAYYAFVPMLEANGDIRAQDEVRFQTPTPAFNEVWMVFERYRDFTKTTANCEHDKYFQVCQLWNATYDLNLSWENGIQTVTGTRELMHPVSFPPMDPPGEVTEMARHAYSAYFWVLADQLVGSFSLFEETEGGTANQTRHFPVIRCRIQDSALLGSPDLAVFFDYNEDAGACQIPYGNLSAQRRRDVNLARGRHLGPLIEELGFNVTISLMHNELLTNKTERVVTEWLSVNRYGYDRRGLWIPYGLACAFTCVTIIIGMVMFARHGVMPGNKFQDILAAADSNVIQVARSPDLSQFRPVTAEIKAGAHVLQVGGDR
ncbi:hypothetical protein B0T21DRAFT_364905 [Apiosordaria backusii]|uniref:Uncharacterized protein n=1 Tax=Apiosordaria backusii TaxID=314023 RepID=A0AA40BN83_9PEZI|nr:hypothetical protein B0T21DRAFT_364905 [Apiosordaria backusii]